MLFFNYILKMLGAVISFESKVDKRGRQFLSLKFNQDAQRYHAWVKTLVIYPPNKKGNIVLLVNHGGIKMDTGLEYPASTVFVLKKVNPDLYVLLKKGKLQGFVTPQEVALINAATPQVMLTNLEFDQPF